MNDSWWRVLLRQQQDSGFADISGAEGAVTLPIADTLLTAIVQQRMPSSLPISHLDLFAQADGHFSVRVKLKSPAFLPAFTLRFVINRQPALPESPYLGLQLAAQGMKAVLTTLVRAFAFLPRWVRVDADGGMTVDLYQLAAEHGFSVYVGYLSDLQITTAPGRFVVSARAILPAPS